MGIFDRFLLRKKARELGFTTEQYEEYMQYQESDALSVEDYRMYLGVYAERMTVRAFIDVVLRVRAVGPAVRRDVEQETTVPDEQPVRRRRRQAMLNMEQAAQMPQQSVPIEPQAPAQKEEEALSPEVQSYHESIRRSTQRAVDSTERITQRVSAMREEALAERARAETAAVFAKKEMDDAIARIQEEAAAAREKAAAAAKKAEAEFAAAKAREAAAAKEREAAAAKAREAAAEKAREDAAAKAREAAAAKAREAAAKTSAQPAYENGNAGGGLYPIGEEPPRIRERLDRLFEKLDAAYPDKLISGLTKNHKHWAETVSELYKLLGYPDSWSFLEAYGYRIDKQLGGRPVKDRAEVIDELKKRYPRPVEGSVAFLMEQNPDLAPRIKTLQNSAQTVFGMRLADYLKQEGILAEKKEKQIIEKPVVKQETPEEKLEKITAELKRRYPTVKSAPGSFVELKAKNADLPIESLKTLTQKVAKKTAGEYCLELGLICDVKRMKEAALESSADGRDGWGKQFFKTVLDRGVNMFVEGEVKSLEKTANGYTAKVKGTSMYSVNIGVSGDEVRSMSCTCPYAADGFNCKHMAAVLFEADAKLYAPKVKKDQPAHVRPAASRNCGDNEILIVSKDEALLRAAVSTSYIDSGRVSIHSCAENPAYHLCEVQFDEREVSLSALMEAEICPRLDGRGIALGRQVDDEHEISDIGFYDGECLWYGSEFDLMYPDSDAPNEPEEWAYECNFRKGRTWTQSKKVWKKIWNKIPYYKVCDLIAFYEENCIPAVETAAAASKERESKANASGVYPPDLNSIRNASSETCDIVPIEKTKKRSCLSGAAEKDYKNSTFAFWSGVYFRGPSVCIEGIVNRYRDRCEIKKIEDFGNGIAQACLSFHWGEAACVFEIMKHNPVLRAACFAYFGGDNSVMYSETGCKGFTHAEDIDSAKNEGDHWMLGADVLADAKYSTFDTRSGTAWREDYRFPFRAEWEKDQYVMEENGQTYMISPRGSGSAKW